jgi:hypothetical protein
VTVRSAVVHQIVEMAWQEQDRFAWGRSDERRRDRQRRMKADVDVARRLHPDDREARQRAMMEVLKRYRLRPWGSLGRRLLGSLVLHLPALWSERKQGLTDRIAGIIVVRD